MSSELSPAKADKPWEWKPGQSGNPAGRPKIVAHIRELARKHTIASVNALVRNLRCGIPQAEVAAAKELLDRGYGKSLQKVDVDVTLFDAMDPATRAAIDGICAILAQQLEQAPAVIEGKSTEILPDKAQDVATKAE